MNDSVPFSEPEPDDSPPRSPARALVESFGWAFYEYEEAVRRSIDALTDDEVVAVERVLAGLTETNCWYATYEARGVARAAIARRRFAVERAAARAGETTP